MVDTPSPLACCPNPWCDSTVPPFSYRVLQDRDEWAVACGCGFMGPILPSQDQAEAAWNTRKEPNAVRGTRIYVRWSSDGQHIRHWSREPFAHGQSIAQPVEAVDGDAR